MTTKTELNARTLNSLPANVRVPSYDRIKLKSGIAHIGVGNFHRAHEALFVERCLNLGEDLEWGIVGIGLGVGSSSANKATNLKAQDCLYTLTEYAPDGSATSSVIGAIVEYLHAPDDLDAAVLRMADPAIRIVSLTITEGGYNIDEASGAFDLANPAVVADLAAPAQAKTPFGLIVAALALRRARGSGGFTILSCDNLRSNGAVAKKAVLGFAGAVDAELAAWIGSNCSFPNSMVDRIAPNVGRKEMERANELSGIADKVPVIGESFIQWVVEDAFVAGRPDFGRAGVQLRSDVDRFEAMKGRLLNASHMMLSYPALLCGYRLVDEAMEDPDLVGYLDAFMSHDVIPLVVGPEGVSLDAYRRQVIERFSNKAVGDQLLRIAHNGIAKLPIFLSRTLVEINEHNGDFARVALCLASFQAYLRGDGLGQPALPVDEPMLTHADAASLASQDPLALLKISAFRSLGLDRSARFSEAFSTTVGRLQTMGLRHALQAALPV
jgi:mannitol-1-phosphate/altronate dehydrogenase